MTVPATPEGRREALKQVYLAARACTRCPHLAATRTQVVFGAGNADADLVFVGEAPGQKEDEQGIPFVGAAGRLLSELLGEVGIAREDVFIANVLKCRPPQNRNPEPEEIERCSPWLWRQLELIEPVVVVTLGNFSTKLLRRDPTGIARLHGQVEERVLGTRRVRLMPSYHPAAALYQRSTRELIAADFARIPELLALGAPQQPPAAPAAPDVAAGRAARETAAEADGGGDDTSVTGRAGPAAGEQADAAQLGLF